MEDSLDHTILKIALSDKRKAFDLAFNQHWQVIYLHACRKIQSDQVAKDITQEVFLVLWNNMDDLAGQSAILPYLYGILRNMVFRQYEKDAVRLRYAHAVRPAEWNADNVVEDWLQQKELYAMVSDEIDKMPPRMKMIYALKKEENLSINEISNQLRLSEQTVKNQLQNAYNRLRTRLKGYRLPVISLLIAVVPKYFL
ncbi:MAG: sigma-70 family RNA polymerase sigma factor [Chitinophagaceae bacterium]